MQNMSSLVEKAAVKVPEITLVFWLIKIAATTLGETAGDAVSMSMNLGYLAATGVFAAIMVVAVSAQVRAPRFSPFFYWTTIIATTTLGTTLADFADRSLGIGVSRRQRAAPFDVARLTRPLAQGARDGVGRFGEFAQGRGLLLGDDHVLADAGNCAG